MPETRKVGNELFIEDANGYLHKPNGFYVKDANGFILHSPRTKKPQNPPPKRKKVTKVTSTIPMLEKLEDSIFNHGDPYRQEYLTILQKQELSIPNTLENVTPIRHKALRHCFDVLLWRPGKANQRVWKKNPANPYTRDK